MQTAPLAEHVQSNSFQAVRWHAKLCWLLHLFYTTIKLKRDVFFVPGITEQPGNEPKASLCKLPSQFVKARIGFRNNGALEIEELGIGLTGDLKRLGSGP